MNISWKDNNLLGDRVQFSEKIHLLEWVTIPALMDQSSTSDFTKVRRRIRTDLYNEENVTAKLVSGSYNRIEDSITLNFVTPCTAKAHGPNYHPKKTDPARGFVKLENPSGYYNMKLKILNAFDWLRQIKEHDGWLTEEDVRVLLESAYVQVFCNDPSFHWQGSNWAATQLDASVYPTEIAPKVWNSPKLHGDSGGRMSNFLCKHLTGLINQIGFFIPKIRDIIIKIQKKFQIDL